MRSNNRLEKAVRLACFARVPSLLSLCVSPARMNQHVGRCGLCRNTGELRDSHLLPAASYKLSRIDSRSDPNPVVVSKRRSVTTSRQVSDYFLCSECEINSPGMGKKDMGKRHETWGQVWGWIIVAAIFSIRSLNFLFLAICKPIVRQFQLTVA